MLSLETLNFSKSQPRSLSSLFSDKRPMLYTARLTVHRYTTLYEPLRSTEGRERHDVGMNFLTYYLYAGVPMTPVELLLSVGTALSLHDYMITVSTFRIRNAPYSYRAELHLQQPLVSGTGASSFWDKRGGLSRICFLRSVVNGRRDILPPTEKKRCVLASELLSEFTNLRADLTLDCGVASEQFQWLALPGHLCVSWGRRVCV